MFYSWRLLTLNWINICSKVFPPVKNSQFRTISLFAPRIVLMRLKKKKKIWSEHSRRRHGNMIDLCPRAYSSYLKYHTRHDCSQEIAKLSIFLMLSSVCFVFREGMWNGVQVDPPTHYCWFENFLNFVIFFYLSRTKQLCISLSCSSRHKKLASLVSILCYSII